MGLRGRKLYGLEKLHNEELGDFLVFLNVVRVPKSKKEMAGTRGMCGEEKKCLQAFGRRLKDVGIDGRLRLHGS